MLGGKPVCRGDDFRGARQGVTGQPQRREVGLRMRFEDDGRLNIGRFWARRRCRKRRGCRLRHRFGLRGAALHVNRPGDERCRDDHAGGGDQHSTRLRRRWRRLGGGGGSFLRALT